MFAQPVPERPDRALEAAALPEGRRAPCERIALVLDNLSAHGQGALHTAPKAPRPRELSQRVEFRYPPQRGR